MEAPNAPAPFLKNSKRQTIVWDGKNVSDALCGSLEFIGDILLGLHFHIDPKVAAGPIVLAATDIATILFYFTVATILHGNNGYARPTTNPVGGAIFTIDAPPWITGTQATAMAAQDGAFDNTTEIASGSLPSNLSPGRHMLYMQARDNAGNWGPVTAQWVLVARVVLRLIYVLRS